jgi:hypothetical protein
MKKKKKKKKMKIKEKEIINKNLINLINYIFIKK